MIVRCLVCEVSWDIDYDPPRCEDPDHTHVLIEEEE